MCDNKKRAAPEEPPEDAAAVPPSKRLHFTDWFFVRQQRQSRTDVKGARKEVLRFLMGKCDK